jgi:hypothetical protein
MQPGTLDNVTYGSWIDSPYTSQHKEDTAMIVNGMGFKDPASLVDWACLTEAKGEK